MDTGTLTLQEAADLLGKSTQTVRRLIKKGELQAERVETPQGFQYAVFKASMIARFPRVMGVPTPPPLTIQTPIQHVQAVEEVPTPSPAPMPQPVPLKKEDPRILLENEYYYFEPSPPPTQMVQPVDKESVSSRQLFELVQLAHKEKLMLITILERLQAELERERQRPKSFFQWISGLWKGRE